MARIEAEMHETFFIRRAEPTDVPEAVEILHRSIMELCRADHQNDRETLAMWLGHRAREERFLAWLANKELYLVVAQAEDGIAGVGMLHLRGEVRLCYVPPGMQRHGIGSAILRHFEEQARLWGLSRLFLESTRDGRAFYERHGFVSTGEPLTGFGVTLRFPYGKPM